MNVRCRHCAGCLAFKKFRHLENLTARIHQEPESADFVVFAAASWNFDRDGRPFAGRWARVKTDSGWLVVAAGKAPFARGRAATREQALAALALAVAAHPGEGEFVKTGRAWSLPKDRPCESGRWEQGLALPRDLDEATLRKIAEANGVGVRVRPVPGPMRHRWLSLLHFDFPAHWRKKESDRFYEQLRTGEASDPVEVLWGDSDEDDADPLVFRIKVA
jgi:hypothetical protein